MSLKKVAARMHLEAKEKGVSRRRLNSGLILSLWYRDAEIILGIRKQNIKPSEQEVKTCVLTFFFSQPIEKKAEKGTCVWVAVRKEAIYGKPIAQGKDS